MAKSMIIMMVIMIIMMFSKRSQNILEPEDQIRSTSKFVALRKSKTHRIVALDGSLHPCNHAPTAPGEFFAGMKRPAIASKESQKRSKGRREEGRVVRSSSSRAPCRKERGGGDASRQNCFREELAFFKGGQIPC